MYYHSGVVLYRDLEEDEVIKDGDEKWENDGNKWVTMTKKTHKEFIGKPFNSKSFGLMRREGKK